jgi:hypothetical protein
MNIEKMLAECRAHWEKTKPDAVFADYWIGWQASRESLVIELPEPEPFEISAEESLEMDPDEYEALEGRHGAQFQTWRKCKKSIESAGLKVKS